MCRRETEKRHEERKKVIRREKEGFKDKERDETGLVEREKYTQEKDRERQRKKVIKK